jgi:hypothetical protein
MLAYEIAGDLVDDCMRLSNSTCLESIYRFCKAIVQLFRMVYLRDPNVVDIARLLSIKDSRGFMGCLKA